MATNQPISFSFTLTPITYLLDIYGISLQSNQRNRQLLIGFLLKYDAPFDFLRMFKAQRRHCHMCLRRLSYWLPKNNGCRTVGTADDAKRYCMATIISICSITVPGLITLGAVHDTELIPWQIRIDPEHHLGIAGRILHRLIVHST